MGMNPVPAWHLPKATKTRPAALRAQEHARRDDEDDVGHAQKPGGTGDDTAAGGLRRPPRWCLQDSTQKAFQTVGVVGTRSSFQQLFGRSPSSFSSSVQLFLRFLLFGCTDHLYLMHVEHSWNPPFHPLTPVPYSPPLTSHGTGPLLQPSSLETLEAVHVAPKKPAMASIAR